MKTKILIWLVKAISKTPLWLSYKLAWVLGHIIYWLPLRENHLTASNLDLIFAGKSKEYKNKLRKKSLIETLKTLLETPWLWQASTKKINNLLIEIKGSKLIDNSLKAGHGVILAIPHIGSWEILGQWVFTHYPTIALYRRTEFLEIDQLVQASRSKNGARLVPDTNKGVISLLRGLKNQNVCCILPDQDPGDGGSLIADFFNIPARTSTLIPKLAKKTGAIILMAYAIRLDGLKGFKLIFKEPAEKTYDENLELAVTALNKEIEKIALEYPEQYTWSYNRYKSSSL